MGGMRYVAGADRRTGNEYYRFCLSVANIVFTEVTVFRLRRQNERMAGKSFVYCINERCALGKEGGGRDQPISVARCPPALSDAIGVDRSTATAYRGANCGPFAAAGDSTNYGPGSGSSSCCQFVTVFLPEASTVFVTVAHAGVVGVIYITVSMPKSSAGSSGRWNSEEGEQNQHQEHCCQVLHANSLSKWGVILEWGYGDVQF